MLGYLNHLGIRLGDFEPFPKLIHTYNPLQ